MHEENPSAAEENVPGPGRLWLDLLGPPALWLVQFQLNYMLVPWACVSGHAGVLRVIALISVATAITLGGVAWHDWRKAGATWPGTAGDVPARQRFLATLGLLSGGLFLLVIIAQGLTQLFIDPCRQ